MVWGIKMKKQPHGCQSRKSSRVSDVRSWQGQGWKFLKGNLVGVGWLNRWSGRGIQLAVLCTVPYCILVFNLQLCRCSMCSQRQIWKPGRKQNVYTQEIGHNQTLATILESSFRCWVKNLQVFFSHEYQPMSWLVCVPLWEKQFPVEILNWSR